ncbi:acyl-CoA dehydrogenase family protein [Streptomyces sp. OR43]|uniref:acyl-CoA dehydrogenase family protein n=1 Tax=Streptomyces sp. or43 TaxID=2478957 RepID=UPI0021C95D54|nr:acyl-CoA dehydrogenase family protein [Streptomyces sp. or43]
MDFTPSEEQAAAQGLAARIFGDLSTHDRLVAAGSGTDAGLWKEICAAGLPGAAEETGLLGLVLLAEEQGRTTAQVPFVASCVYGLLAVAEHGTDEQRERLLPSFRDGTEVAAGAFPAGGTVHAEVDTGPEADRGLHAEADRVPDADGGLHAQAGRGPEADGCLHAEADRGPAAEAGRGPAAEEGGRLSGVVPLVPWLRDATHVLVAAADRSLWFVRTAGPGVVTESVETTAPWSAGRLVLDGAPGERLGGSGAYEAVLAGARTAFAGVQAGVCAGSLARAVEHTGTREQFGRPLSTNQAVLLRAADAYMDTEAIRVTAYEAAWRHDEGLPYVEQALTSAWWASEAGRRVVHAGQHLHGGTGADLDHPVHRHFLWGRQLDAHLGGSGTVLQELGELLVKEGPE